MTQDIYFSLILPAHNEEARLPGCIEKVASFVETFPHPIEVLIVENGSADRTFEMAQAFAEQYPWLRAIKDYQRGKRRAVRIGMLQARGKYRFFADVEWCLYVLPMYQ